MQLNTKVLDMLSAIAFSAIAGSALAAEWKLVPGTSTTTLVGVGSDSATSAVAAAAQNQVGAVIEQYNGQKWNKVVPSGAGMLLDAAVAGDTMIATSVLPILISKVRLKKIITVA